MIAYRGLLTNLGSLAVIALLGWHGCTSEVAYLAAAGVAGAHAWRGGMTGMAQAKAGASAPA